MAPTPAQARAASHRSWARTEDRTARTAPGNRALMLKFEKQVDPDGVLPLAQRLERAESARRAYFTELAIKSAAARRRSA